MDEKIDGKAIYLNMVKWLRNRLNYDLVNDLRIDAIASYIEGLTRITIFTEAYIDRTYNGLSTLDNSNIMLFVLRITSEMCRECIFSKDEYVAVCSHLGHAEGFHCTKDSTMVDIVDRLPSIDYSTSVFINNPWATFIITLEDALRNT